MISRRPRSIAIEFNRNAHRWRLRARRCISSTGPVSRNGRPCPFSFRVITKRPRIVHSRSASNRTGKQRGGKREKEGGREMAEEERMGKKRTECFRIIREGLSFSRTRLEGPRARGEPIVFRLSPSARKRSFTPRNILVDNGKAPRRLAGVGFGEDARAMFPVRTRERH